ncbi:MAG: aminotransferase class V-fold PLP-dependent enzyme, partial [Parvularculaceae bacterium]
DAALEEGYASPWNAGDGKTWGHWFAALQRFRENLAPLIGAEPDDICPQTNISGALTKIVFALPERARRRKIVLSEDDFPTVGFVLAQARRLGYELVFLPGGARLADIAAWSPAFHDDVQLVLATHVFSNSSVCAPVAEIAERARQRGVFSIIDIGQSAGAVPVDLKGWRADFAVGTSVKYLCGGPGAAFLWTEEETAARCLPLDVGWFSHEAPFEMDIRAFRYAAGATRFMGGTPSVAPFAAAAAGARILADAGIEAIHAHNQRLIGRLIAALPQGALRSHGKEGERGCSALVAVTDVAAASRALAEAGFIHDERLNAIRVSAHLYNTDEDVDSLLAALEPWL